MGQQVCVVCGDALNDYNMTSCRFCGGKFHQPWDVREEVPPCGHIVPHNEALAIVFICNNCYIDSKE